MSYIINKFSKYTREFNYNLKLAYPVMIGMLGHTFVQFVDNVMVGQLGTAELAAISLGNSFVFIAMSIGIGFSTAITPLIAEADGAKNKPRVIEIFEHSFLKQKLSKFYGAADRGCRTCNSISILGFYITYCCS